MRSIHRARIVSIVITAAKVMDVIARLPDSAGQAADADMSLQKNEELEPKLQKCKSRVVLRGDIVKDDSGAYAVFTEQGSTASQRTAAKIMERISRLPGCDGQAADAASAKTQVKTEDAPRLLKIPKSECPDIWIRLPRHKRPKSWSGMEDPAVPLERNLYGHLLAGLLCERQFEAVQFGTWMGKIPNRECLFVHRKQGFFRSENVDDTKMAGKKQNTAPVWKKLMKNVDLNEPSPFLDPVYLGCTQRERKTNEIIIEQYTKMFWITYFCWNNWKITRVGKPHARTVAWSYDMEGHARKCVERSCELAKKTEQLHKVSSPCLDDHTFKKEELKAVGELSNVCSLIVLKKLYLARIGRLDILWSINKLVRTDTKWIRACDKRLARLISYIHHTNNYRQFCHVGNTAQHSRLGLFQDSDFAGDLEDFTSTSGRILWIFGRRTIVPTGWMCKKQTSVSHSSTVAEIIFVGCWFANGWYSCSWFVGCGDRSVTFVESQEIMQQGSCWKQKRVQRGSRKLLAHV